MDNEVSVLSINDRLAYLVTRYVFITFLKENEYKYPEALNVVILRFLGNILIHFDVFNDFYKECVQQNGHCLKIEEDFEFDTFTVGCSYGFNKGITEIRIQCVHGDAGDEPIGIGTSLQKCYNKESWFFDCGLENVYGMYSGNLLVKGGTGTIADKCQYELREWLKNDTLTVRIDCHQRKVSFFINDELMGNAIDIQPNRTYYLTMSFQTEDVEYRFVYIDKCSAISSFDCHSKTLGLI